MNQLPKGAVIIESQRGTYAVDPHRDPKIARDLKKPVYVARECGLKMIGAFVNGDSTVVDGGAHIGTYAVPLASMAKKVIAFEPNPETFEFLKYNVELNKRANLDARNKGLGKTVGKVSLAPITDGLATSQTLDTTRDGSITLTSLDEDAPDADVVKIDVEGMEADVLRGAEKLISSRRPVFIMEIFPSAMKSHGSSPKDIEKFLRAHDYVMYLPIEQGHDAPRAAEPLILGKIITLSTVTALIMPGWFLKGGQSLSYDIVAVPREKQLPQTVKVASAIELLTYLTGRNLQDKVDRIHSWLEKSRA